ncbi:winged helix-turn-helix domain-containing protein [Micromonospora sp. NPDC050695]|uniref:winged helix-turn-helix domain-containing protein n=1 Tax=Micromonospora sp. NPDC050695 TaxID=3154938 RepID=UPI0033C216C3
MARPAPSISSEELAAMLRDQILSGQLKPGARIPSDRWLRETHGVSRGLVRLAKAVLRSEGLVVTRQGKTSRVRPLHDKSPIDLTGVVKIEVRMPTAPERARLGAVLPDGFDEGVPVWVVWKLGAVKPELLPGDRWMLPGRAHA